MGPIIAGPAVVRHVHQSFESLESGTPEGNSRQRPPRKDRLTGRHRHAVHALEPAAQQEIRNTRPQCG